MSYPVYYPISGDTLPVLFNSFDSAGASVTLTGLAVTDIEIYKDGGTTQRSSDAGYTLLDTDGIDFDSLTGIHGFSLDLSDNTDAGFYAVGPWYHVVVSSVTIDGNTVSFVACAFRILDATRGMAGTALPDAAADAAGGLPISDAGGLDLDTQIGTDIDAILVDTAEIGVAGAGLTNINLPNQTMDITGNLSGSVGSVTGAVGSVTGAVGSVTAEVSADVTKISGSAEAADNLEASAETIITGFTAVTGTLSTTQMTTDLTEVTDDHYNGRIIIWKSGVLQDQATNITDYDGASKMLTFTATTEAPSNLDAFVIV